MVLRIILRYLANNEQLVHRLSESYPVRRAAQLVVGLFYRSKSLIDEHGLRELTPEKFRYVHTLKILSILKKKKYKIIFLNIFFRSFIRSFKNNIREEIEDVKNELKKKKPK